MDEQDLLMAEEANKTANERVHEMLRQKMTRCDGQLVDAIPEPQKRLNYAEELEQGNVHGMLAHKLGQYERLDAMAERQRILENIDIVLVVKELGTLDGEIKKEQEKLRAWREREDIRLDCEYELVVKDLFSQGYSRQSLAYMIARTDYLKAKDALDDTPSITDWKRKIQQMRGRRSMLEDARERYARDNAEIIAEIRRQKVKDQVLKSGLLK